MTVYFNGDFMQKADVSISPDDRGFVFGDGVYEVVRAEAGTFFRLAFPDPAPEPTVYARADAHEPPLEKWRNGVKVILQPDQRWARCDIKSLNYLPNVLANQAAQEADAYEALLVRDGFVTEGSHSSVAAVFDGTVTVHPFTNRTLPSITRQVMLELCDGLDLPVEAFPVEADALPDADELFLMGTTTGIMPVVQVEDWMVGDGTPGPVTQKLSEAFRALEPA